MPGATSIWITRAAGADYTATSGTLTFAAGETAQTVTVAVRDDSHDEGAETMTLTLAGRGTEVVLACNILNQMTVLGRPMSYRIGR